MADVLVTGGAGFIGSHLVDILVKNGCRVTVVDNLNAGIKDHIHPSATFYKLDICNQEISGIFEREKFNFVFHLASRIGVQRPVKDIVLDNKADVLGSLNILINCWKHKVEKIIFSSSGGAIYGDVNQIPTNENTIPLPVSPYGIHKLIFEKYLNYYHQVFGQRYIAIRQSNIYGPRQFNGGTMGIIHVLIDNGINGKKSFITRKGTQTRDFLYVDDLIDAYISAMDTDYNGVLNVGSGAETSILQIIELIKCELGCNIEFEFIPSRPGEQARSCLDVSKAKEVLGWQAKTSLKEGIAKTVVWHKSLKH